MDEILPNLGMELPDVGSDQDTWGDILNENLRILDNAVTYDAITKTLGAVDVTLTTAEAAHGVINLNGTLTANVNLIVPATPVRVYLVRNQTSGAFTVTVKTAAGTGTPVQQGTSSLVYSDGTNIIQGATSVNGSFAVSGALTAGSITGTPISGSTGSFTTLSASGATTLNGAVTLGDAAADAITVTGTATFAQATQFPDGTAALPAITNTGDTNTGRFYPAEDTIAESVGGIEALRITSARNLLVGTTNDIGSKLDISTSGANLVADLRTSAGFSAIFEFAGNGNGVGSNSLAVGQLSNGDAVVSNRASANLIFGANNAEAARITSARYFKASNTGTYVNSVGGFHEFTGADSGETVFVNTTSTTAIATHTRLPIGSTGFHYLGELLGTGTVYQVLANGNVQNTNNSYGAISDAKLKENVVDASSYLDRFMQVRFRNFNFIGSDLKQFGVIAQELETVFPGLVEETPDTEQVTKARTVEVPAVTDEEGNEVTPATTREEEYTESVPTGTVTKSVKYSVLNSIGNKVTQELAQKVIEHQAIINTQQAQIDSILARLTALEAR